MSAQASNPVPGAEVPAHVTPPQTAEPGRESSNDDLMSRVVAGAHDTIDRLAETAAPHVERLQQAGDQMGVRAEHLREIGDEWTQSLRETIRQNPLAAVAVAAALGVLLARVAR